LAQRDEEAKICRLERVSVGFTKSMIQTCQRKEAKKRRARPEQKKRRTSSV
jgi:hypothetical protein